MAWSVRAVSLTRLNVQRKLNSSKYFARCCLLIEWNEPEFPGGVSSSLSYDTIRSTDPEDYVTTPAADCAESDGPDTVTTDFQTPDVGTAFFYIIRPENACPFDPMCQEPGTTPAALVCTGP